MKRRIAFVNPFIPSLSWFFYSQGMSSPPWGMLKTAQYIKQENQEVFIIDGQVEYEPPGITVNKVLNFSPDAVVVMPAPVLHLYTFMAATALPYHLAFLRALKKQLPGVKTILGGLIPRRSPGLLLAQENAVDIIILENTPLAAADSISELMIGKDPASIPGIAYRDKNGEPQINKPFPNPSQKDREIFASPTDFPASKYGIDQNLYLLENHEIYPVYPVIGMFGCPFRCSFCATPLHFPEPSKPISPGNFVDNIETAITKHHSSRFSFWDDTLTRNPKWIKDICNLIIDHQLKIQWWCFGKVDWILANRPLLPLMRKAGCTMTWLGVESTEDNDLVLYNKKINFHMAKEAVKSLTAEDILATTSFILGNINDDENKTRKIVDISGELTAQGAINIYTLLVPLPGTVLFEMLGNKNVTVKKDLRLFNGTRALLDYPGMKGERLEEIFFESYQNSVLNDRFLLIPQKSVQKKQEFETLSSKKEGPGAVQGGLGRRPILKNIGRTNFALGKPHDYDKEALLQGFAKEKMRMLALEKTGYLDDDPQQIALSCQWVFEQNK